MDASSGFLPGEKGPQGGQRRGLPAVKVIRVPRALDRFPIQFSRGHERALPAGLADIQGPGPVVPVGAGLPVRCDGDHDQPGIFFFQDFISQPEFTQFSGLVGLDQDIGFFNQILKDLPVFSFFAVEGNPVFIGIEQTKEPAFFWVGFIPRERPPPAGRISFGDLNLDHLRPEIRKELGAVGPGKTRAEFQNRNPAQGKFHGRFYLLVNHRTDEQPLLAPTN